MQTLILGLGNPIRCDDIAGLRVARSLREKIKYPEITVIEATAAGLDLLDLLSGYEKVIIIDAVQTEAGEPGAIYRLEPGEFASICHADNPHSVDFGVALELGKKLGLPLPEQIIIFGIEVRNSDIGEECSPEVTRAIPLCVARVMQELTK